MLLRRSRRQAGAQKLPLAVEELPRCCRPGRCGHGEGRIPAPTGSTSCGTDPGADTINASILLDWRSSSITANIHAARATRHPAGVCAGRDSHHPATPTGLHTGRDTRAPGCTTTYAPAAAVPVFSSFHSTGLEARPVLVWDFQGFREAACKALGSGAIGKRKVPCSIA